MVPALVGAFLDDLQGLVVVLHILTCLDLLLEVVVRVIIFIVVIFCLFVDP